MSAGTPDWLLHGVVWWVRRNPMYLISAVCMALAARLFLDERDAPAGAVVVILLTFVVLQVYEWCVGAVACLLRRARRGLDDLPSLLLVAALFWTGPLMATLELSAARESAGASLAFAAAAMALVELWILRRLLCLNLGAEAITVGLGCLALAAMAPSVLRIGDHNAGTNELALYLCWWVLAATVLPAGGAIRQLRPDAIDASPSDVARPRPDGAVFAGITLAATVGHLAAMNYAFCGHARAFYLNPVAVAVSWAIFASLHDVAAYRGGVRFAVIAVPIAGVLAARQGFDAACDSADWPPPLRDAVLTALLLAASVWAAAARVTRSLLFLHLASGATLAVVMRVSGCGAASAARWAPSAPAEWNGAGAAVPLYAVAAYLAPTAWLCRSQLGAVMALLVQYVATNLLIHDHASWDRLAIALLPGWNWLLGVHVLQQPAPRIARIWGIAYLLAVTLAFDLQAASALHARVHMAGMVMVFALIGCLPGASFYRWAALNCMAAFAAYWMVRGLATGPHPAASLGALAAFACLAGGIAISWTKRQAQRTRRQA